MTPRTGGLLASAALGVGLLGCSQYVQLRPLIVFNTTASAPVGFYRIDGRPPEIGDLVIAKPPPGLAAWMSARHYLPTHVPLIKRLAAVDGQVVCGRAGVVSIDGRAVAKALRYDRLGRRLQPFEGCRRLQGGEVFLLNVEAPYSLDGRYFGPFRRDAIVGRATALWTWGAP